MSSGKWRPSCRRLNVLKKHTQARYTYHNDSNSNRKDRKQERGIHNNNHKQSVLKVTREA